MLANALSSETLIDIWPSSSQDKSGLYSYIILCVMWYCSKQDTGFHWYDLNRLTLDRRWLKLRHSTAKSHDKLGGLGYRLSTLALHNAPGNSLLQCTEWEDRKTGTKSKCQSHPELPDQTVARSADHEWGCDIRTHDWPLADINFILSYHWWCWAEGMAWTIYTENNKRRLLIFIFINLSPYLYKPLALSL